MTDVFTLRPFLILPVCLLCFRALENKYLWRYAHLYISTIKNWGNQLTSSHLLFTTWLYKTGHGIVTTAHIYNNIYTHLQQPQQQQQQLVKTQSNKTEGSCLCVSVQTHTHAAEFSHTCRRRAHTPLCSHCCNICQRNGEADTLTSAFLKATPPRAAPPTGCSSARGKPQKEQTIVRFWVEIMSRTLLSASPNFARGSGCPKKETRYKGFFLSAVSFRLRNSFEKCFFFSKNSANNNNRNNSDLYW